MDKLINEFENLIDTDLTTFTKREKIYFYQNSLSDLNKIMNSKSVNDDAFEKLLEIKKDLLAKLQHTEDTNEN